MSGDHLERLEALVGHLEEISRRAERSRPGDHRTKSQITADFMRQSVDPDKLRGDLRAAVDELKQLRAEREADDLCARTAAELLAAIVAPDCDTDRYGNCAMHGVLVLDAGSQCPHVLARAFLSSARLWLDPAPQQPAPDGGEA